MVILFHIENVPGVNKKKFIEACRTMNICMFAGKCTYYTYLFHIHVADLNIYLLKKTVIYIYPFERQPRQLLVDSLC